MHQDYADPPPLSPLPPSRSSSLRVSNQFEEAVSDILVRQKLQLPVPLMSRRKSDIIKTYEDMVENDEKDPNRFYDTSIFGEGLRFPAETSATDKQLAASSSTINPKLIERRKGPQIEISIPNVAGYDRNPSPMSARSFDNPALSLQDLSIDAAAQSGSTTPNFLKPQKRLSAIDRKKSRLSLMQSADSMDFASSHAISTTGCSSPIMRMKFEERTISAVVSQFTSSVKRSMIASISPMNDVDRNEENGQENSNYASPLASKQEEPVAKGPTVPDLCALPTSFYKFDDSPLKLISSVKLSKSPVLADDLRNEKLDDDAASFTGSSISSENAIKRIPSIQPFQNRGNILRAISPGGENPFSGLFHLPENADISDPQLSNILTGMVMSEYYSKLFEILVEGMRPGILKIFRNMELTTFAAPVAGSTASGIPGTLSTANMSNSDSVGNNPIANRRRSTSGGSILSVRGSLLAQSALEMSQLNSNPGSTTPTGSTNNKSRRRSSMMTMLDSDSIALLETVANKSTSPMSAPTSSVSAKGSKSKRGSSIVVVPVGVNEKAQDLANLLELLTQVHNTNESYKTKVQQMIGYMLGFDSPDDYLSHVYCLVEAYQLFQSNSKALINGKMWDILHVFYSSKLLLYFFGKDDFRQPSNGSTANMMNSYGMNCSSANYLMLQKSPAVIDDILSIELLHCLPLIQDLFQRLFELESQYKRSYAQYLTNPSLMRKLRKRALAGTLQQSGNAAGAATTHIPIRVSKSSKRSSISLSNSPLHLKKSFKIPSLSVNVEQMIAKTESIIAKLLYLLVPHHLAIMEIMYRIHLIKSSCLRNSVYYKMIGRKDLYKIMKKCANAMDNQLDLNVSLLARAPETLGGSKTIPDGMRETVHSNPGTQSNKISERIHTFLSELDSQFGIPNELSHEDNYPVFNSILENDESINLRDDTSVGSQSSESCASATPRTRSRSPTSKTPSKHNFAQSGSMPMLNSGRQLVEQMNYVLLQSESQVALINQYRESLELQRQQNQHSSLLDVSSSSSSSCSSYSSDEDLSDHESDTFSYCSEVGSKSDENAIKPFLSELIPVNNASSLTVFDTFSKSSQLTSSYPEMYILSADPEEHERQFDKLAYELTLLQEEYSKRVKEITSLTIEDMDMIMKSNVSVQNLSKKLLESSFKRDDSSLPSIAVLLLRAKSRHLMESVYSTWPLLTFEIPMPPASANPNAFSSIAHTLSCSSIDLSFSPNPNAKSGTGDGNAKRRTSVSSQDNLVSSHFHSRVTEEIHCVFSKDLDFSQLDFANTRSLRKLGFSLMQLRDSQLYTWSQLLAAGYPLQEIKYLRMLTTGSTLPAATNSHIAASSLLLSTSTSHGDMGGLQPASRSSTPVLDGSIPQHELTVSELRRAGYSIDQCVEAGFNAMALKAGGFDELQLVQSGLFTANQLKKAGCDVQRFALTTFFQSMDGKYWKRNTNWCSQKSLKEWYGIKVNQAGNVISIDLRNNELVGELPDALYLLSSLEYLDLYNNHIRGKIPVLYQSLVALKDLWLDGSNSIEMNKAQIQSLLPHCRIRI